MRYILLLILITFTITSAQNYEADTLQFYYGSEPTVSRPLNPNYDEFKTNKFLRGFHWSGDSLIDKLMGLNVNVSSTSKDSLKPNNYCDSTLFIKRTFQVGANGGERTPLQAQAMQFDARLKIDLTKDFNYLENDNLQSIFGFQNVRGRREGDYQVFEKNASYANDSIVLSENWPSAELEHTLSSFVKNYNICK